MTEIKSKLFDTDPFVTDPRLRIPERLGRQIGQFFNTSRYVTIFFHEEDHELLVPGNEEDGYASKNYAEGTDFEEDFSDWRPILNEDTQLEGFLVGFPRITSPDGSMTDHLHIWMNNSDIFAATYAIPLVSLRGLHVHSKLGTDLRVELDELANGALSRYEIPFLRSKDSDKTYYRDASYDDIDEIIEVLNEKPYLVFDPDRSTISGGVLLPSADQMKTLLD